MSTDYQEEEPVDRSSTAATAAAQKKPFTPSSSFGGSALLRLKDALTSNLAVIREDGFELDWPARRIGEVFRNENGLLLLVAMLADASMTSDVHQRSPRP